MIVGTVGGKNSYQQNSHEAAQVTNNYFPIQNSEKISPKRSSEETGRVSLVSNGKVFPAVDETAILRQLFYFFDLKINDELNVEGSLGVKNEN